MVANSIFIVEDTDDSKMHVLQEKETEKDSKDNDTISKIKVAYK